MSSVRCPKCRQEISVQDIAPGRHQRSCPKCRQPFTLTIPAEPGRAATAEVSLPPVSGEFPVPPRKGEQPSGSKRSS
jgi:hypothetical protein